MKTCIFILSTFLFLEANANLECRNNLLNTPTLPDADVVNADVFNADKLKRFLKPFKPEKVVSNSSTTPDLYFFRDFNVLHRPFERPDRFTDVSGWPKLSSEFQTKPISHVIESASNIAVLAGIPIPKEVFIHVIPDREGYYYLGTRVISAYASRNGNSQAIKFNSAHEFGHLLFEMTMEQMLPPKYREMFKDLTGKLLKKRLRGDSFVSINDLSSLVLMSVSGINELFADLTAMIVNDTITTPENFGEITGLTEVNKSIGRCFEDDRTFSSTKLIEFSGQYGVMAQTRVWLGKHRLKKGMSEKEKAFLLKTMMLTNVALVTKAYDKALETGNKPKPILDHDELIKANSEFLDTFLAVERALSVEN